MWIHKIILGLTCAALLSANVCAVVNNASKSSNVTENTNEENTQTIDENNRRESIISLPDTYGPPISVDTYTPTGFNNQILPVPVYGVPDGPTNHIVYPPPPPDIPPPITLSVEVPSGGLDLGNTYGPPEPVYGPPKHSYGLIKPVPKPAYGLPKPTYGPPKPTYGPPKPTYGLPKPTYGPPKNVYGPPKNVYGPPKNVYGPPKPTYGPPKPRPPPIPHYGPPLKVPKPIFPPKPIYGPPRPQKIHKPPIPQYGPPLYKPVVHPIRPIYGPPKIMTQYGPPLFSDQSIPIHSNIFPPKVTIPLNGPEIQIHNNVDSSNLYLAPPNLYGPPKDIYGPPKQQHFLPEPIPHGPPKPGIPAPPTPPDIKYDGWQPIPGLVSKLPEAIAVEHHHANDLQFNKDFVPPPSTTIDISHGNSGGLSSFSTSSHTISHSSQSDHSSHVSSSVNSYNSGLSDSYGAPLNTVTGSGGVVGHDNPLGNIGASDGHSENIGINHDHLGNVDDSLSIIKSVGYELNNGGLKGNAFATNVNTDSYSFPPLNSFAPNGPYPPHKNAQFPILDTFNAFNGDNNIFSVDLTHFTDGLIPPSGVYGVPPNGKYGTPLISSQNNFDLKPPKQPVVFRQPVPTGLIESVGHNVALKDAHNIIESQYDNINANTYVPPPVPDVTKPKGDYLPPQPSSLYSLPNEHNPPSFQNLAHGNSFSGSNNEVSFSHHYNTQSHGLNGYNNVQTGISSYAAPLAAVEGQFSQFAQNAHSSVEHNKHSHDLVTNYASKVPTYETPVLSVPPPNDCQLNKNYNYNQQVSFDSSQTSHNNGDLQIAYSVPNTNIANDVTSGVEPRFKVNSDFQEGAELIKSQSLDLNNIDIQGALGRYTLQIQPADSLQGGASTNEVPHTQVLNDGLLQSILAAIEQPQNQYNQQSSYAINAPEEQFLQHQIENVAQQSAVNTVAINPSFNDNSTILLQSQIASNVPVIDNNSIAVYLNNTGTTKILNDSKDNENKSGSFVTFDTPESSYTYGDLNSSSIPELNIQK